MKVVFVSNYINHHQIPFCNAMAKLLEGGFTFLQTEPMEEERVRMGWNREDRPSYVKCWYEEPEICERLLMDCDAALFGGTEEESYIQGRLRAGKLVIRVSERLYRTGQWKAVSPRGLKKKYRDHTRYRNSPVYLLCNGAYVPSDFHIIRAYPGKMYCFGYFPETRCYDEAELFAGKGFHTEEGTVPYLLWAARMIDLKHPELALATAASLQERGLPFHLEMIGDGQLRNRMEEQCRRRGLEGQVCFSGFLRPEQVRKRMEQADIFLFTSDRREGWGAVANEAMNSGCALIADHMIGAVPYLVHHGVNGYVYRDGHPCELFAYAAKLVSNPQLCRQLGENAIHTITSVWNAESTAEKLVDLIRRLLRGEAVSEAVSPEICFGGIPAPCAPAPVLGERKATRIMKRLGKDGGK